LHQKTDISRGGIGGDTRKISSRGVKVGPGFPMGGICGGNPDERVCNQAIDRETPNCWPDY